MFSILEQIVEERMRRRLTTVIDTLGFDGDSRRRWVALAHEAGLCLRRRVRHTPRTGPQSERGRSRPIPKTVLDKQLARFRVVRAEIDDDGFDSVLVEQPVALVAPSMVAAQREAAEDRAARPGHRFGLVVNRFDWGEDRSGMAMRLASIASRAETAGFDDLWVMDHFRQIPQVGRQWEDIPEAYTTLAFPGRSDQWDPGNTGGEDRHRHPVVLGKMVATLDVLSGGRVSLGLRNRLGPGEHEGYGIPFNRWRFDTTSTGGHAPDAPPPLGQGLAVVLGATFSASELICYPRNDPGPDPHPHRRDRGERRTLRLVARYAAKPAIS